MGGHSRPVIPVIVGPTAVGKTAVVLALHDLLPVAVISADSRQVYRGLDIGTAKASADERARVPHYGVDVVDPGERYSAGRFAREATGWLQQIRDTRQAVVVGGTGFYVRALTDGLFREPPLDRDRRARLRAWLGERDSLASWARRLDTGFTGGGRQRAARAVEVALLTGKSLSWWQRRAKARASVRAWTVRLTVPRAVLRQRIAERVEAMVERGLVGEVRTFLDSGVPPASPGLDAVGYREVIRYLHGELDLDAMVSAITIATGRYAKRQETWFRHQLGHDALTLDATGGPQEVAASIHAMWRDRIG
ncbi:MAG TPA: tRNA (adenosine(37)-N6)-dimethylallyltransferase MiaA [Gemmatimonadales bacterium]